jgi:chaperonin GroES
MTLEPLGTKIVVKVEEAENKTAKGIIIPDAAKEKPTIGVIVAINDTTKEDFNVDVGTRILFGKYAGTEVVIEKEKLLIIEMDEAFAIIRE